jgi:MAF protein
MQVVLASSSPYRSAQLRQIGLTHLAVTPDLDEDAVKNQLNLAPEDLVIELGFQKARSVQKRYPQSLLIGSDQMVVCEGKILGKGKTVEKTCEQLAFLSGRQHALLTSLVVITPQQTFRHLERIDIQLRALSQHDIRRYVELDQPLDCAGSYKYEQAGICLVETMQGRDTSAILGLPLIALTTHLIELGMGFPFAKD